MKKILYTAIIGNYDRLYPILQVYREGWEAVCFTDRLHPEGKGWNLLPVSPDGLLDVAMARKVKILSHKFVGDADISIWIDGNVRILTPLDEIVDGREKADFALFQHPRRDCVYQETTACIKKKKADPGQLKWQMKKYRKAGFPAHSGLMMTAFLFRRRSPKISEMNETWWGLTKHYGTWRDQITLPLALRNLKYAPQTIPYKIAGGCFEVLAHRGSV